MRTAVTLDLDVRLLLERRMRDRGVSLEEAVNGAIRVALAGHEDGPTTTPIFPVGLDRTIDWDKALSIAGDLEDAEVLRRYASAGRGRRRLKIDGTTCVTRETTTVMVPA